MPKISVRKETGTLVFDFRIDGKRYREQTALKDSSTNRRKMEKVLERIERDVVAGTFDYSKFFPGSSKAEQFLKSARAKVSSAASESMQKEISIDSPLFFDFSETWFSESEVSWRLNTQKMHRSHLKKHLLPTFGAMHVHEIKKANILAFRAALAKAETRSKRGTLSPKTINEIMNSLLSILTEASDRYEFPNPGNGIKRLKLQKTHIDPLSLDEVNKFLSVIRVDYRNYFTVRFFTGLRTGEVHGLKWKNVDFDRREILVRETFSSGRTEYTKNDGSQREVRMSEHVYKALKDQHLSTGHISEYVFCSKTGSPIDAMNVNRRIWKPTLTLIGLEERRLYQTRHTSATFWLAAGESPEWIAYQMGHTSTEMLFRVYSRYVPNLTRQDGSAFDRLLAEKFSQPAKEGVLHER